ncbi:CG5080 [Drosophila busckii]|uniref:CG5080 n=1 Tax=Drosophila busckii TaxID=30019 RepID=A0A0M3QT80_DROBS|nr:CG5080 [Drosophila busckii]
MDDLGGTMKSIIYSYNQLDNKLQRHEHRERALGEILKTALQTLLKGQKNLEPINGIFTRLDERVSQIETMLITQEEKYNAQSDKFNQAVDHMFKWMRENDECFNNPPGAPKVIAAPAAAVAAVPNAFVEQQQKLNKQLLDELKQLSGSVAKLLDSSKQAATDTQKSLERLPKTDELMTQIEAKLQQHSAVAVTTAAPPKSNPFESQLLAQLNALSNNVTQLCGATPTVTPAGLSQQDKSYMQELNNETLNALAALKSEAGVAQQKSLQQSTEQLQQVEANIQGELKSLSTDVGFLNSFNKEINASHSKLNEGFDTLSKFNNIMMTNSEVVLETQRKVEFGTLQIVQKVNTLVEQQVAELTTLLKQRFTALDESMLHTQLEASRNISGLLESDLTKVWHRIEIMNNEIRQSRELLILMQSVHDGYVNGTFNTMMGLSSKVEETKKHMIDMDTNLNYLLGKLSLMSSEFGNIKKGLADSLVDLRNSFQMIHERMPSSNAGPHNIEKNQYLTDVNLLSKRHAQSERV